MQEGMPGAVGSHTYRHDQASSEPHVSSREQHDTKENESSELVGNMDSPFLAVAEQEVLLLIISGHDRVHMSTFIHENNHFKFKGMHTSLSLLRICFGAATPSNRHELLCADLCRLGCYPNRILTLGICG